VGDLISTDLSSFALCETYSAEILAQQAHPEHQHNLRPLPRIVGIMGGAGCMNLGHDDVEGLKAARRVVLGGETSAPARPR
jgi:hypothetical protein